MPDAFRIILAPQAAADIEAIHDYIAQDSPANAALLVERILDAISRLAETPGRSVAMGRSSREKTPVRSVVVRPYVIFFRAISDQKVVRVLTIRHAARRRPKRFP